MGANTKPKLEAWKDYKSCNDPACARECYRGIYSEGLECFNKRDIPTTLKWDLRDMNEYFELTDVDQLELMKIRNEEQKKIEGQISDKEKIDLFWSKVFGMGYE